MGGAYDFTYLWVYDFLFWVGNVTLSQKKMSPRDEQVGLIEFCLVLSCLGVCIDTWRRADALSRGVMYRRKNLPHPRSENGGVFYDFTNLWFYDFPIWVSNLLAKKKERRRDGHFGFMQFRPPSPCVGKSNDTSQRA